MENTINSSAMDAAVREAGERRAALEADLTYAARQRFNRLLIEQQRERYRQTQRLAEFKKNYDAAVREPDLTWQTSPSLRRAAWRYAAQARLMTYMRKAQDRERDRFLERAAALRLASEKPSPENNVCPQPKQSVIEQTARGNISASEVAFREAANRRAAMEARLSELQRARYQALRQKQQVDLDRQERRLAQRREIYETEVRKHGIAPRLEMIPMDWNTPRALRDAAREYSSQDQWVADLRKTQERECERFLERAIAGEPEPERPRRSPRWE
ncbi:MAG: hypothetical protein BGO03_09505 [Mesorhizobium sp. 61-13]|nr:MAG: hypothetical protein BGO03_09505 [Mesorhizobium sp. 61-13]